MLYNEILFLIGESFIFDKYEEIIADKEEVLVNL